MFGENGSAAKLKLRSRQIQEAENILRSLAQLMRAQALPRWLRKPNRHLDKMTPLEAIGYGKIELLWEIVNAIESGPFS